ncbi:MAG: adenylate/guanylate cyclase domain-containing protein [Chloroflexi bacterium]|nr:adenylate/guanylate cyclase domain-containing protein [Chloroflexota bacterium]
MATVKYRYNSLEDFLVSTPLTVDGQLDDGWGAIFPVKGKEIEATILFADISRFSARTLNLSPTETLIFANNFFAWISAEAIRNGTGIIDKYIGDEIMIVFSKDFGAEDPFVEAVQAARWMSEHDALSFEPHIGIASGSVIVGYIGTPIKYNCSVFGAPVALAARCAAATPEKRRMIGGSIIFPAAEWQGRDFHTVFPPRQYKNPQDGTIEEIPHAWMMLQPRVVNMKNIGEFQIQEIINQSIHEPSMPPTERARLGLRILYDTGRYWPDQNTT